MAELSYQQTGMMYPRKTMKEKTVLPHQKDNNGGRENIDPFNLIRIHKYWIYNIMPEEKNIDKKGRGDFSIETLKTYVYFNKEVLKFKFPPNSKMTHIE